MAKKWTVDLKLSTGNYIAVSQDGWRRIGSFEPSSMEYREISRLVREEVERQASLSTCPRCKGTGLSYNATVGKRVRCRKCERSQP
jgi:excinuclease UvrABC ATPase subunit